MNPIFGLILKELPRLVPVAKSLLRKAPTMPTDDRRLSAVEESLQLLAERSDYLEARLKRMRMLVFVIGLFSLIALIAVLVRS